MVLYRRNRIAGATYFFTAAVADRCSTILTDHIDQLRQALRETMRQHPLQIDAMVVLPDHIHALWTLPGGDDDYSARWRRFKALFTRAVVPHRHGLARNAKGEWNVWQRRFWEHTIRDDLDFGRHADYIHFNPVKHGLVKHAAEWQHSTFHRFVSNGVYPMDWGGAEAPSMDGEFGE